MTIGLKAPIVPGEKLQLKLTFERSAPVSITAAATMDGEVAGEDKHGGRHAHEGSNAHGSQGMRKK